MKMNVHVTESFIGTYIYETKEHLEDVASANRNRLGTSHLLALSFPRGNPQGASAVN